LKADLHIHTNFSNDGVSTIEEVAEFAVKTGLGCISVTDHNKFEAYDLLKDRKEFIIIPGEEVSSAEGHILAYGIQSEIERGMSIIKTIESIHDAGGIAVAAHPYRWWSGLGEKNVIPEFDGVEAFNSRSRKKDNRRSFNLATILNKPITGGSDAHAPEFIGKGYTVFQDNIVTWEDAVKAIMNKETDVDGGSRGFGETLKYTWKSITQWAGRGFRKM
jgi:Predicted metal-dependent phosphoesterases (PHP family)